MSLAGDDPEHVVVVPGGLFAPTAKAGLTDAIGGNKVESDFAEQGKVAGGGAMAHSAIIFSEGDIENPVQSVLDAPVAADGSRQNGRIFVAAGEKVADLGRDPAGAVDGADRLDRQQGAQIGPFAQGLELCDGRARKDASAGQAAMAVVKSVESRPAAGAAAEAGTFEMSPYGLEGATVIGLQRQQIVGTFGSDPRGDVLLAPHRVERHDGALEMQDVEQLGNGGDLIRLAVDFALSEHQFLITCPGADQMQRAVIVARAAGLSRDWGSCRDGCWRMRIVGGLEALPEAGAAA